MSWWNPLDYIPFAGSGTSANDLQATAEETRQAEQDLYDRRLETGYWTQAQYDAATANSQSEYLTETYQIAAINDEFRPDNLATNLGESADAAAGGIKRTLNGVGGFVWGSLPWWVIVGGLVALFVYLGGGVWIRGLLTARRA